MSLAELRLEDLRCLRSATLELDPHLNLITGDNGTGKTSILEAIYLLGRGRSFRTRHTEQLVLHGEAKLLVLGRLASPPLIAGTEVSHLIGLSYHRRDGMEARIDGRPITSLAQLSTIFPVQVIDPGIHRLVEEGRCNDVDGWTGRCSTWNQTSYFIGRTTVGRSGSATQP